MDSFYLYLHSQDSPDIRKNNNPSEFWIQLPKSYHLEGQWACALTEITLDCDFTPISKRLYLCCDFIEETYVRNTLIPVLRNVEIGTKSKKLLSTEFTRLTYQPVTVTQLTSLRLYIKDEHLNPVIFGTNDLHCVIHFKKIWAR